ncbi:MAG: gliding motility-associated protein GldE [Bacteroidales bacterium]|nr:gliding motility-associated protein GldE [Bacteroidales bacterium]MCF8333263.1 gliding motility-associated protein GldE [Bacteroidales bacterium]
MEDPEPFSCLPVICDVAFFESFSVEAVAGTIIVFVLLFLSALVSGAEVAFFSLEPQSLKNIRTQKGYKSRLIVKHLERPRRLLATILITNNFVNVAIVMVSAFVTSRMFDFGGSVWLTFLVQVVVITSLLLIFGEIMPKMIANHKPVKFATMMAIPINVLMKIFYQFSSLLVNSTNLVDRKINRKKMNISIDDISEAIDIASNEPEQVKEKNILKGIVRFSDTLVREIMKSRVDITAIEYNTSFEKVLQLVINSGYSRIPVYKESFDKIQGILYIKDLLPHLEKKSFRWQSLLRQAYYVPQNKPISDLLQEFQGEKIHLAMVVDEYGGTSGIITLEDIIEEIVGEISDEFDNIEDVADYQKIDRRSYIFEAKTPLNDFCKVTGVDNRHFEEFKGESDTIAGLILEHEGEIPDKGKDIKINGFSFTIQQVDKRRIIKVKVRIDEDVQIADEESDTD